LAQSSCVSRLLPAALVRQSQHYACCAAAGT
jgi:hypothetical protein